MTHHFRKVAIILCAATTTAVRAEPATDGAAGAATRPNVIFVLTDDQGWGDFAAAGHPYMKTPNLDRLAREGTRFDNFYVSSPVCAPSRVAFMTGHFPARHNAHHIYFNPENNAKNGTADFLDPGVLTVPQMLKNAGYRTAHIGKWHLCGREQSSPRPDAYGFDDFLVSHDGGQSEIYKSRLAASTNPVTASSHWIMEDAIEYLKQHKDDDTPFFLNLWTLAPHALLKPSPEELRAVGKIEAKADDFESWMRTYLGEAPDLSGQMEVYCASMTSLDAALGKLLAYLDESGLAENTIIIFSSDNGPEDQFVPGGEAANAGVGSTGPFRGRKRSIYAGGVRVPCLVRWPGHVPAGRVIDSAWCAVDLLPTLADLAGVELPAGHLADGESMAEVLAGAGRERSKPIFWEWKFEVFGSPDYKAPSLSVLEGPWKFYCQADGTGAELYDLAQDPGEKTNLADRQKDRAAALKAKVLAWKKTIPQGVAGSSGTPAAEAGN